MSEPLIVVERNLLPHFEASRTVRASSPTKLREAIRGPQAIWIARSRSLLKLFASVGPLLPRERTSHRLLLLGESEAPELSLFGALFDRVVTTKAEPSMPPEDELLEVLASPDRANLFIGASVVPAVKLVMLLRGDLTPLAVPFSFFSYRPSGPTPDFSRVEIVDFGQTIRLGEYEAAGSAVLYEYDAGYRKQQKARRISVDTSFGGALRRLRLQRGLRREDFRPLSAKTIARLERNATKAHASTLSTIAARLRVKPEDIATF